MELAESQSGTVAAAVVAASAGCFTMGVLMLAAAMSKGLTAALSFYAPAGALSGEGVVMVSVWLGCWAVLARVWARRAPALKATMAAAYVLLGLGLCLSFPPVVHLLTRR